MVHGPNDQDSPRDKRIGKPAHNVADQKEDSRTIYNTPYQLTVGGLEKVEVYPY